MNLMKQYGPLIITLAGTIGAAVFTPAFIAAHPFAFAVVGGIAQLLHAVLPSIFGDSHQPPVSSAPEGGR